MKDTKMSTTELRSKIAQVHKEARDRTREAEALAARARELPAGSLDAMDWMEESKGLLAQVPTLQAEERQLQRQLIRELTAEAQDIRERLPVVTMKARERIDSILGALNDAVGKAEAELRKLTDELMPKGMSAPGLAISYQVRAERTEYHAAENCLDIATKGINSALYSRNAEIQQIAALLGGR
jgi:FtsZ-binding cell division protein ZapB